MIQAFLRAISTLLTFATVRARASTSALAMACLISGSAHATIQTIDEGGLWIDWFPYYHGTTVDVVPGVQFTIANVYPDGTCTNGICNGTLRIDGASNIAFANFNVTQSNYYVNSLTPVDHGVYLDTQRIGGNGSFGDLQDPNIGDHLLIPFEFFIADGAHYGWFDMNISNGISGGEFITYLNSVNYDDVAYEPVLIPYGAAVPAPSSLLIVALGFALVLVGTAHGRDAFMRT